MLRKLFWKFISFFNWPNFNFGISTSGSIEKEPEIKKIDPDIDTDRNY